MVLHNSGGPNDRGIDLQVRIECNVYSREYGMQGHPKYQLLFSVKIQCIVRPQWYPMIIRISSRFANLTVYWLEFKEK